MAATTRDEGSQTTNRTERKRQAILDAATEVFLHGGYLGTNMDEIAARSSVSKQTVYKQFGSKEALFVEIVTSLTDEASVLVLDRVPPFAAGEDVRAYLEAYAMRQLEVVLTPRLMQLRRLVIGEVARFPDLARVLYERGPGRAVVALTATMTTLADHGEIAVDDPTMAAAHFNWLVMSAPLNQAMLLGDAAIPSSEELRRIASEGVRVFLAAYGAR